MSYSLVIPPEYLGHLVAIRSATGISIRKQILMALESWVEKNKEAGP